MSLPSEWKLLKLKEISLINNETLSNNTNDGFEFKYIDLSSVKNGKITFPNDVIKFKNSSPRARRIIKHGDVLLATVRPNLLGYGLVKNWDNEKLICSTGFAVISAKENSSNKFIYQSLYSDYIQNQIQKLIVGSNYPAINSSDVENLLIIVPPLPEQQKIAEILSTVDEKIEVIEAQINQTTALKKGLMQQLLTKGIGHTKFKDSPLGKIPESWDVEDSLNLFELVHGYQFRDYDFTESGLKIIKIGQIGQNGKITLRDCSFISPNRAEEFKKYLIKNGDILMALTGATLGKSCIVDGITDPVYQNYRVGKFVPIDQNRLNRKYLYFLLNSPILLDQVFSKVNSGAQGNIGKADFVNLKVPLPALNEQIRISQILETLEIKSSFLSNKRQQFSEFKKGLMQQLLTGKLRVNVNLT